MVCSKCNQDGVKNVALGKEFYYCRGCKVEIGLETYAQLRAARVSTSMIADGSITRTSPKVTQPSARIPGTGDYVRMLQDYASGAVPAGKVCEVVDGLNGHLFTVEYDNGWYAVNFSQQGTVWEFAQPFPTPSQWTPQVGLRARIRPNSNHSWAGFSGTLKTYSPNGDFFTIAIDEQGLTTTVDAEDLEEDV